MFAWIVIGTLVVAVLTFFIVNIALPRLFITLATYDTWWSPVRILPPQGEFYILVDNTPDGPFSLLLESIEEKNYDSQNDKFSQDAEDETHALDFVKGVAWVGLNKRYLVREMQYTKWEQLPGQTSGDEFRWGLVPKLRGVYENGKPPSYFWRYDLAIFIDAAEINDNVPINAIVDLTIEIESPRRAFFFEGGWISKLNAAVQASFRQYVGDKTLDMVREDKAAGATELVATLKGLSGASREEEASLRNVCGIKITDARFVKYATIGSEEMQQAIEAVAIARRQAEAEAIRGRGAKRRRREEAKGIRETVAAYGSNPVGGIVANAEAIASAKPSVIGGGVMSSVPIEGVKKEPEKKEE